MSISNRANHQLIKLWILRWCLWWPRGYIWGVKGANIWNDATGPPVVRKKTPCIQSSEYIFLDWKKNIKYINPTIFNGSCLGLSSDVYFTNLNNYSVLKSYLSNNGKHVTYQIVLAFLWHATFIQLFLRGGNTAASVFRSICIYNYSKCYTSPS